MFTFNEHNVCINPSLYTILNESSFQASIKTAEHENRWLYGYEYTNTMGGYEGAGSSPSFFNGCKGFDTENDAKRYAVENIIIRHLKDFSKRSPKYSDICQKYINKCEEYILDTYQLSLF